jgi:hypothetical protein
LLWVFAYQEAFPRHLILKNENTFLEGVKLAAFECLFIGTKSSKNIDNIFTSYWMLDTQSHMGIPRLIHECQSLKLIECSSGAVFFYIGGFLRDNVGLRFLKFYLDDFILLY